MKSGKPQRRSANGCVNEFRTSLNESSNGESGTDGFGSRRVLDDE